MCHANNRCDNEKINFINPYIAEKNCDMANNLDLMDIRQIINLLIDGLSNRKISEVLGISRNTVNNYAKLIRASTYTLQELKGFEAEQLSQIFPGRTTICNKRYDQLMTFLERANTSSNHPGFTFLHNYNEYSLQVDNPYSYTQFLEHYARKYPKQRGSMKLHHEPGNELFIDFAGKKLSIVDKDTGELVELEVFVAILPSSQYTFVEACESQKREDLIKCTANALAYYGGVPKAIVSDNLKSAVSRSSKYEPDINRAFKEFASHYNCVINPTRSYRPQDKALVENAVHLVYQRIYYPMRNMTFFSVHEINQHIRGLLNNYNNLLLQRKDCSRMEQFQRDERQFLKPLPSTPFEIKDYKRAKVQKMGYVYFSPDKSYYSVPFRYIGKSTQIHYTQSVVEVYYDNQRLCTHKRVKSKGVYITDRNHLSSSHKQYAEWSPAFFDKAASKHGEYARTYINRVIDTGDYPEVNYKRALGIIRLHKLYGSNRLNNACGRALALDTHYSFNIIKNILENNLDSTPIDLDELNGTQSHIPTHSNTRGSSNYN